jgi:hypothetical protein
VVILNVLNSLVPVYTDSLVLYILVKEKASHSDSKLKLAFSMGTPILLKFMRLAKAVMYIHTSAEFILTSFVDTKGGVTPDTAMDMARMWNVYIFTSLQLVDNLSVSSHHVRDIFVDTTACRYSFYVHLSHTIKMWKSIGSARPSAFPFSLSRVMLIYWSFLIIIPAPLNLTSIVGLVWSFSLNYILPIVLNAAQLAISSYLQTSNIVMLIDMIDSAKVVINIASAARVTTLSTKYLIDLPASSALFGKAEDVARDMLKVVPVPPPVAFPDDAIEATVSIIRARTPMAAPGPGPATGSQLPDGAVARTTVLNHPALDGIQQIRGMIDPGFDS